MSAETQRTPTLQPAWVVNLNGKRYGYFGAGFLGCPVYKFLPQGDSRTTNCTGLDRDGSSIEEKDAKEIPDYMKPSIEIEALLNTCDALPQLQELKDRVFPTGVISRHDGRTQWREPNRYYTEFTLSYTYERYEIGPGYRWNFDYGNTALGPYQEYNPSNRGCLRRIWSNVTDHVSHSACLGVSATKIDESTNRLIVRTYTNDPEGAQSDYDNFYNTNLFYRARDGISVEDPNCASILADMITQGRSSLLNNPKLKAVAE